jgi:hypothetical protein
MQRSTNLLALAPVSCVASCAADAAQPAVPPMLGWQAVMQVEKLMRQLFCHRRDFVN